MSGLPVRHRVAVDEFERMVEARPGDTIAPLAFPDIVVDVAELFGGMGGS